MAIVDGINASPVVAILFERAFDALIDAEKAHKGHSAIESWAKWRKSDPSREERGVAQMRAAKEHDWAKRNYSHKFVYVKVLFSPFEISEELKKEFIASVKK